MKVRPSDDVIVVISTLIFLLFLKFNQFVAVILTRSKSLPYFLNVLNRKKKFCLATFTRVFAVFIVT